MIRQLTMGDEVFLRKWLLQHDPVLALHHQLTSYFLKPTTEFGAMGAFFQKPNINELEAVALFSKMGGISYIHQYMGSDWHVLGLSDAIGVPCQMFYRYDPVALSPKYWTKVMDITPGLMLPNKIFDTVFSRTVPRFKGAVYERLS